MHLRISAILCCTILIGLTSCNSSQSSTDRNYKYNDDIDIDADLEGSGGGGKEVSRDLVEASGSGHGPYDDDDEDDDDDDDEDHHSHIGITIKNPLPVDTTAPPAVNRNSGEDTESPKVSGGGSAGSGTFGMDSGSEDSRTSVFVPPGMLAAVIGGAVVGLLCAILVVMFIVYRMRKKDEGSYALDEPKRSPTTNSYCKGNNREFYA